MIQICKNEYNTKGNLKDLYEKLAARLNEMREGKPVKDSIEGLRTE